MNWHIYINDILSETLDEEATFSMLLQQTKRNPKYLRQQMIDCKLGKSKSISTVNNGNIIEVMPEKVRKAKSQKTKQCSCPDVPESLCMKLHGSIDPSDWSEESDKENREEK